MYVYSLAHGSYLIASKSEGNAYIVDPRRDVVKYTQTLTRSRLFFSLWNVSMISYNGMETFETSYKYREIFHHLVIFCCAYKLNTNIITLIMRQDFYVKRLQCMSETHNIKLKLKGILMTHAHADFVAGNVELANRVNTDNNLDSKDKDACHSYFGEEVGTTVPHIGVNDKSDALYISKSYQVRPLHTPGHTLGCIAWILEKKDQASGTYAPVKVKYSMSGFFVYLQLECTLLY